MLQIHVCLESREKSFGGNVIFLFFFDGLLSESVVLEGLETDLFVIYRTVLLVLKVTLAGSLPRPSIKY